jgi:glycosyltransferase involved in cell wall biosynthesis
VVPHESRPGDRILTRFAFAFGDFFLVQSAAVEKELLDFKPEATYVLAHHPVYEIFGEGMEKLAARHILGISAKRVILFFGYVRRYKGLAVLLKAMERLDNLLLLVVGEFYEKEEPYRSLIREAGLQEKVRIVNEYVPGEKVPAYFSAADAVILPYLSATQSGIVQMAFNFDRPVIASRIGGLSEVVAEGRTGYLVPPGDAAALAEAIRSFFDRGEAERMSAEVAKAKAAFSWEALVEAIERVTSPTDRA